MSHAWLRSVRSFTFSFFFIWQNNTTSYFSVSLKFEACYITSQRGKFKIKTLIYVFIYFFAFFLLLSSKTLCFYYFNFFFWWSININRILTNQNINQSISWSKTVSGTVCLSTFHCSNLHFPADLVTDLVTEEILTGELQFLYSVLNSDIALRLLCWFIFTW